MCRVKITEKPWGSRPRAILVAVLAVVVFAGVFFELSEQGLPLVSKSWSTTANSTPQPQTHAILIAGSNGWGNYRHQADVAHAYHVLSVFARVACPSFFAPRTLGHPNRPSHTIVLLLCDSRRDRGVSAENIITLVYDDIANNTLNPHPGTIINHPTGKDLYSGLRMDYTHDEVNTKNFLAVLRGDASLVSKNEHASGRVLSATEHDRVFVYYSDHGAPGLLGMPSGDYLYADQLMGAIRDRYQNHGFKEMVLFIEACESGSMFDGILTPDDLMGVWVTTASNPRESSWGVYCPGVSPAPPSEYTTCLGDLYSVAWMEDVQSQKDLSKESLKTLFERVRKRTNLSHVMDYGEREIEFEPVSWYLGSETSHVNVMLGETHDLGQLDLDASAVEQRDADLVHLLLTDPQAYKVQRDARRELDAHVRGTVSRALSVVKRNEIGDLSFSPTSEWDWDCLRNLISTYERHRGQRLGDWGMRHSYRTPCAQAFLESPLKMLNLTFYLQFHQYLLAYVLTASGQLISWL